MTQEGFVGMGVGEITGGLPEDGAFAVGGGEGFVGEFASEEVDIKRGGAVAEFTGFDAAENEDLFHQASHEFGGAVDVVLEFVFLLQWQAVIVVAHEFDGGHDDAEGGAELMGDHSDEAAFEFAEFTFLIEGAFEV